MNEAALSWLFFFSSAHLASQSDVLRVLQSGHLTVWTTEDFGESLNNNHYNT